VEWYGARACRERSCWFFADHKEEGYGKKGEANELTCDMIRAWMGNFSKEKVRQVFFPPVLPLFLL
jgi:hypothetical protein